MFPETKGRTLEEMDELFNSDIPAWKTHSQPISHLDRDIEELKLNQEQSRHSQLDDNGKNSDDLVHPHDSTVPPHGTDNMGQVPGEKTEVEHVPGEKTEF